MRNTEEHLHLSLIGAKKLLSMMRKDGFVFSRIGDKVVVTPKSKITENMRSEIRIFKQSILAILISEGG